MRRLLLVCALVLSAAPVFAQNAVPGEVALVQQTATRRDAATRIGTSATSAATITLTPNNGQMVAIYEIDIQNCAGASAVSAAGVTTITTTNVFGGLAFTVGSGTTAGACTSEIVLYPTGLFAQALGPVTMVLPTFATNQTIRVNVAYASVIATP